MSIKINSKGDKYSFYSDKVKVEFSNPSIQPFDENAYCKNDRGIMYYYYTVKVWMREKRAWKSVFTVYPYDFPAILDFKNMLDTLINNKIDLKCYQREEHRTGVWYTYHFDIGAFAEDLYTITHSFIDEESERIQESYSIGVGKALDYSNSESMMVVLGNLKKEDLAEIYKCVNGFIDYTIEKNNEIVINRNKKSLNSWKVKNGKLYKMTEDGKSVDSVYTVGDRIDDAVVLKGDINSCDFSSFKYCDFVINEIKEDAILFSSGYEENRGEYRKIESLEEIKLSVLLDLFEDMPKEKLELDEEGIIQDFMDILSNEEKEEFRKESIEVLYDKWKDAILNRTWMCRDEHNLPKRVKDTGYHENVYASIKNIVKVIKIRLSGD